MADLGTKHDCFKCHTKFYDLRKPEIVCPKCGANQKDGRSGEASASSGSSRASSRRAAAAPPPPPPDPELGEFEEPVAAGDADDEEDEDLELGADDDDDEDDDDE